MIQDTIDLLNNLNKNDENNSRLLLFIFLLSVLSVEALIIMINPDIIELFVDIIAAMKGLYNFKLIGAVLLIGFIPIFLIFSIIMSFLYYFQSLVFLSKPIQKLDEINVNIINYNNKEKSENLKRNDLLKFSKEDLAPIVLRMKQNIRSLLNALNFFLVTIIILVPILKPEITIQKSICLGLTLILLIALFEIRVKPLLDLIAKTDEKIKKLERYEIISRCEEKANKRTNGNIICSVIIAISLIIIFSISIFSLKIQPIDVPIDVPKFISSKKLIISMIGIVFTVVLIFSFPGLIKFIKHWILKIPDYLKEKLDCLKKKQERKIDKTK